MLRRPIVAGLVLLAAATATVVWAGLLLPPPLWILKYGPTPGCEPTGEVVTLQGIDFVRIGPGCFRMGSDRDTRRATFRGRHLHPLGLPGIPWTEVPGARRRHWVELPWGFGIARTGPGVVPRRVAARRRRGGDEGPERLGIYDLPGNV